MNVRPTTQARADARNRTMAERSQFKGQAAPVRFTQQDTVILNNVTIVPTTYYYRRDVFYETYDWAAPGWVYGMYPTYGIWDATFLAFVLNHAAEEQYYLMLYNHWYDPAIQQWVQDSNRLAADNAELHAQIDNLNARVSRLEKAGTKRDTSYVPPDAQDVALSPEAIAQLTQNANSQ